MGGEYGGEWIHVYAWLSPFAVHLELLHPVLASRFFTNSATWEALVFMYQGVKSQIIMYRIFHV